MQNIFMAHPNVFIKHWNLMIYLSIILSMKNTQTLSFKIMSDMIYIHTSTIMRTNCLTMWSFGPINFAIFDRIPWWSIITIVCLNDKPTNVWLIESQNCNRFLIVIVCFIDGQSLQLFAWMTNQLMCGQSRTKTVMDSW